MKAVVKACLLHLREDAAQAADTDETGVDRGLEPMARKAEEGAQTDGIQCRVFEVFHRAAAGDQILGKQVLERCREHQQQAQRPKERTGDEPGKGPVLPFEKSPDHIGRAQKEGVEHKVVLRHETRQQRKPNKHTGARAKMLHQIGDEVHEHHGQQRQHHVHTDHDHRGQANGAQTVQNRSRRSIIPAAAELTHQRIQHRDTAEIDQPVKDQRRPFGKAAARYGRSNIEEPVVERRVHVIDLVIIDRAEVKALVAVDAHVIQQLLPGDDRVVDAAVAFTGGGEEGVVAGVGKTIGVELVNEHALLSHREEHAHSADHYKHQQQRPAAFDCVLQELSTSARKYQTIITLYSLIRKDFPPEKARRKPCPLSIIPLS